MTGVIDLRRIRERAAGDIPALRGYLMQIVGQPYLFSRVTYGGEFSLHFGTPQEWPSPKLRRRTRGSYVLTSRASAWRFHSVPGNCLLYSGVTPQHPPLKPHEELTAKELEQRELITPGTAVRSADVVALDEAHGIELRMSLMDGSTFFIIPSPADDETGDGLPSIADWELFTPNGRVLSVGPGFIWEYADSELPRGENLEEAGRRIE
jgi:hypothetical protein